MANDAQVGDEAEMAAEAEAEAEAETEAEEEAKAEAAAKARAETTAQASLLRPAGELRTARATSPEQQTPAEREPLPAVGWMLGPELIASLRAILRRGSNRADPRTWMTPYFKMVHDEYDKHNGRLLRTANGQPDQQPRLAPAADSEQRPAAQVEQAPSTNGEFWFDYIADLGDTACRRERAVPQTAALLLMRAASTSRVISTTMRATGGMVTTVFQRHTWRWSLGLAARSTTPASHAPATSSR
jgi:hypothetical protein